MCRVLAYLGKTIPLDDLLYNPDSSLISQTHNPRQMLQQGLNLAGFGMAAWDEHTVNPERPFYYRTHMLPFYDMNLRNLSAKVKAQAVLAHVRGVEYSSKEVVSIPNTHPFLFQNTDIAFAHNGELTGFIDMRYNIAKYMKHQFKAQIRGTTDSEWMYALFLSCLKKTTHHSVEMIKDAVLETLDLLKQIRKKQAICASSPLNFFISNGQYIVAIRYTMDFGHYHQSAPRNYSSLWYTYGKEYGYFEKEYKMRSGKGKNSVIVSSEPLTRDSTTWIEVPEYTIVSAYRDGEDVIIDSEDIPF